MESSLSDIVDGCRKGNSRMQKQLYDLFYEKMMKIAIRYTGDIDKASTVYNDAMLKVFRSIGNYNEEGKLSAWIKKIVVNTALDLLKLKSFASAKEIKEVTDADQYKIDAEVFSKISADDIRKIISSLPEKPSIVFNLYVYDEYDHKEISKLLGIPPGTSRYYLSEARKQLKEKLENHIFPLNKKDE